MSNVSKFLDVKDSRAYKTRQTRITQWLDESDKTVWFICSEHGPDGKVIGDIFYTKYSESVLAWLRLLGYNTYAGIG